MMKYLIYDHKAINLANADDFGISNNYLVVTTGGGLNAREVKAVYATTEELNDLFNELVKFLASDKVVFDCDKFLWDYRTIK
jgi:argonaute-like protein implicated in RNA metabolism and viral defense